MSKYFKIIFMENIRQRLQAFLDYKELKPFRVENETGIAVSSLSRFLKGKDMGIENLMKIHLKYQDLNLDWLFRGEGEMLYLEKSSIQLETRINEMATELQEMKRQMQGQTQSLPRLTYSRLAPTNKSTNEPTNDSKRKRH